MVSSRSKLWWFLLRHISLEIVSYGFDRINQFQLIHEARKHYGKVGFPLYQKKSRNRVNHIKVFTTGGLPPLVKHPDLVYKYLFSLFPSATLLSSPNMVKGSSKIEIKPITTNTTKTSPVSKTSSTISKRKM